MDGDALGCGVATVVAVDDGVESRVADGVSVAGGWLGAAVEGGTVAEAVGVAEGTGESGEAVAGGDGDGETVIEACRGGSGISAPPNPAPR